MTPRTLKARTEKFARTIVAFCTPLLRVVAASDMARQLLRSGTAVDSNYGSAQRARSHREFTARIGVVYDEAAESLGWLRLLESGGHGGSRQFQWLLKEAEELTRIFNKSHETARAHQEPRRKVPYRRKGPKTPPHPKQPTDSPDNPIGDNPIGDNPIGDNPIGDNPIGDDPIGDDPISDDPIGR